MNYSPESLVAFVEAVACGSFSAAARKLQKSQSTISTAISNLEIDLGLTLFSRASRQPELTLQGERVLACVQEILAASEQLDELAMRLSTQTELQLCFVFSDTLRTDRYTALLNSLAICYPDLAFESLFAEETDVLDLIQSNRANMGILRAQDSYPVDIAHARLQEQTEMAIFLSRQHPFAQKKKMTLQQLSGIRQLCLNTYTSPTGARGKGPIWSAPSYFLLLEMAESGFGWSILPRWLVDHYGHNILVELPVDGWPKTLALDIVWSRRAPPGPVGQWLIDSILQPLPPPGSPY